MLPLPPGHQRGLVGQCLHCLSIQAVLVTPRPAPVSDQDPRDVKYLRAIKTVTNSVTGDSVATLSHVTQRAPTLHAV